MKEIIEQRCLKIVSGVVAGCAGLLAPAVPLMIAALTFMVIDFLTGVLADRRIARSEGRVWHFESRRAWRSVRKVSLVMVGIVMASA
ncbi:MAG: phage holin family protein, partial [Tidjanibacter sp.]|nr:phage holin family protein [Tidjanibacter sp.]